MNQNSSTTTKQSQSKSLKRHQDFDYFLVLDFEATCDKKNAPKPQEIIEFPIVVVDSKTLKIIDEFHYYVLPDCHPKLTEFCTELTGISQDQVDAGIAIRDCLDRAEKFCKQYPNSIFVTCGHWDLKTMLPSQATYLNYKLPKIFKKWINIKIVCQNHFKWSKQQGMPGMLRALEKPLVGRHHSGIDDARNIATITIALIEKGIVLKANN